VPRQVTRQQLDATLTARPTSRHVKGIPLLGPWHDNR
jgi:hypothetical protein